MSTIPVTLQAQLSINTQLFNALPGQTAFALPVVPNAIILVAVNGACVSPGDDYSLTGPLITLLTPAAGADRIMVIYA